MAVELGVPGESQACDHNVPTFGCQACITKGREGFAREAYLAWKKTYKLPTCCKRKMKHDGFIFDSKEVRAIVTCQWIDSEGESCCPEEEIVVVIA